MCRKALAMFECPARRNRLMAKLRWDLFLGYSNAFMVNEYAEQMNCGAVLTASSFEVLFHRSQWLVW